MAEIKRNPPWITKAVLSAIKRRNTLFRTAKSTGKPIDRAKYNSKRNEVVNMLRECKQSFFNQQLNNVDTKTFWKTVRSLSQSSSSTIPMLQDGDKTVKSSLDKATTLNNFFYTCFNRTQLPLRDTSQEYLCPSNCPDVFLCTEDSVFELLTKLEASKSTGSDGVSPRMLKCTASCIAPVLCKLFNLSISSGTFPTEWKLGRITPIPKGTDSSLPSGYRPISVLPVASKLIERHVKMIVEDYLQENSPISKKQWGFMSSRSTVSALIRVIDDWLCALDQGYEVCVVFFDVSKAFDTVPHLALLSKLSELGLDPFLLRWIRSYLSNRSQYVSIDGVDSHILPVISGVPQGSVLGPLLFILYINDVATVISAESEVNMFADDIALYRIIKSSTDYSHLQNDINSISVCIKQKHLQFNTNKCKLMLITKKKDKSIQPPQLVLDGVPLARVHSYKYLGITLTSNLCWSPHIMNCCNKARRPVGLLYRQFYENATSPTLLKLYCSFIRPHLEYAAIVWNPALKGDIELLENAQKFALRVCMKSWNSTYQELLTCAKLPSLQDRRTRASLCHLFKIINDLTDFPDAPVHTLLHNYDTRSSTKLLLAVPQCRTLAYQYSFFSKYTLQLEQVTKGSNAMQVYHYL